MQTNERFSASRFPLAALPPGCEKRKIEHTAVRKGAKAAAVRIGLAAGQGAYRPRAAVAGLTNGLIRPLGDDITDP
jgi:hypothetical protein